MLIHSRIPWLCSLLLLSLLPAVAVTTFALQDYLHQTWTNEMVTFTQRLSAAEAKRAALFNEAGQQVPVQVRALADGQYEVSFIVDTLPADGKITCILRPGKALGKSLVVKEGKDAVVLDAGSIAARVPAGNLTFKTPVSLKDVPAPLLAVRGHSGKWLGAGKLLGDLTVTGMKTMVTASGPVFAESRTEYAIQGGSYAVSVRVVRGQEGVFIREEFNTPKEAVGKAFFTFNLSDNFQPDRVSTAIRTWRERTDKRTNVLGDDYRLEFDQDRKEMSVLGYVNWWPETARRCTLYRDGDPNGDAISVLPARIGSWRNPMGMYLMTSTDKRVTLQLPLYIDQDWVRDGVEWGNPYYTGKLEDGWPRTAGRRAWVLHCTTLGEAIPQDPAVRSTVLDAIRKYCDLPLDKVKDWVLDWPADPKITYPRLYVEPGQLETVRERVKKNPRWMGRFGSYTNRPISYTITQNPKIGRDLVSAPSGGKDWAVPNESQGSVESLRSLVQTVFQNGYMGYPAPNNAAPMGEFVKFDAAMGVADATDEEKTEMRRLAAFVANMVYDEDWHPVHAGFHLGNPNMPPRQEHHLGVAGCILPDHPLAAAWRKRGEAEALRQIDTMVREGGSWLECPHYEYEAAMYPLFQSAVPIRYSGGQDLFKNTKLKSTWDYLLNISTPPDPRFGTRLVPAFGNGSWEQAPLFGWLANLTRKDDPAFSKRMQWMWVEQGKPDWMAFSETMLDPDLPAEQPKLVSQDFPGFGAILRSGFPSKDETWVAFRIGEDVAHYNYGDQGSFMLYARGAPLVLQFGSQYQPQYRGAWYFNRISIGHKEIKDGLYGGTELFGASGDPEYPGKLTAFTRLETADYAVGQHVSSKQGLVPDDARVAMPPNYPLTEIQIPRHTWTRQMLLMKDAAGDPAGPNYLVMKDNIASDNPLATEWNLWLLADQLDIAGNTVHCRSPFGVMLDIFMADPATPQWKTREDTHTFLAGPTVESWQKMNPSKKWSETLKNLRVDQAPGGGYLAVLYPRKADEAPVQTETLAGGKGVLVTHLQGTDRVFLDARGVTWVEGGLAFTGTAGAIRQLGDTMILLLAAPGGISANGIRLTSSGAASMTVKGNTAEIRTGGPAQTLAFFLPAGATLKVNGQPANLQDGAYRLQVPAGRQVLPVSW